MSYLHAAGTKIPTRSNQREEMPCGFQGFQLIVAGKHGRIHGSGRGWWCLLKSQETRRQAITIKATPPNSPVESHFLNSAFTRGTRVSNMSL